MKWHGFCFYALLAPCLQYMHTHIFIRFKLSKHLLNVLFWSGAVRQRCGATKWKFQQPKYLETWASVHCRSVFWGRNFFFLSLMFDLHRLSGKDRHDLITCTVYICRNLTFQIFRILSQTTSGLRHHCFSLSNSKTTLSKPYRNRTQCKSRALDFLVQWAGYKMTRKPVRKRKSTHWKRGCKYEMPQIRHEHVIGFWSK